jgi:DedD protein
MAESLDPQLPLKKRARRRLVGAIAFAGLAAVVLPMVMDDEPKPQVQDVQISIPGQDQTPFNPPPLAKLQSEHLAVQEAAKPTPPHVTLAPTLAPTKSEAAPLAQPPAKPVENKVEKKAEKIAKPVDKPVEKAVDKHAKPLASEPQRAAAILDGKPENASSNNSGPHVILIGAFANPANVKQLQSKIGDLGIKTFTEPLDSPQGKKTRVRAGPFPNREAAEKALERIKRMGVSGVVAAK